MISFLLATLPVLAAKGDSVSNHHPWAHHLWRSLHWMKKQLQSPATPAETQAHESADPPTEAPTAKPLAETFDSRPTTFASYV
jgi:hypothetical protein